MAQPFHIRDVRLPADKAACVSFIDGLQKYEHVLEPDRRIDAKVGEEYYAVLMKRVAENKGRIFVVESNGEAVGWAVFVVDSLELYIVDEQRTCGYVAELYLKESMRGSGAGKALLAACEAEARKHGLKHLMIGVLDKNARAAKVYDAAGFSPYSLQLRKYL
ncbi:MAG: GNAT family N-acetyltransferase [Proteobacteria bacterium]|nr:GNAT family N-acetyltransferase [Pseudomonadota bacterium]